MDATRLARTFVKLADTLSDDFDVLDMLHVLTTQCADVVGAAAVGLLLADSEGRLRVVVASDEHARLLELFQIQSDEGPCVECYRSGEPVSSAGLDQETRWPRFSPAATEQGFTCMLALPLRLRGEVIGAMNLFRNSSALDKDESEVVQALADVATIAILQDRRVRDRTMLSEQLQTALNSRIAIEQAKGAIANQFDIGTDEAFTLLRSRARSSRRRLVDVATEVVHEGVGPQWAALARSIRDEARP
jgi:GAF domain-containing protein